MTVVLCSMESLLDNLHLFTNLEEVIVEHFRNNYYSFLNKQHSYSAIDLRWNGIRTMNIKNLNSLTSLNLSYNCIDNLEFLPLQNTLTSLNLSYNIIRTIKPFYSDTLTNLNLADNRINLESQIQAIENFKNLKILNLRNTFTIVTGKFIEVLGESSIISLDLSQNQLSHVDNLSIGIGNLEYLNLSGNYLTEVTNLLKALKYNKKLRFLNLNQNPIKEITPFNEILSYNSTIIEIKISDVKGFSSDSRIINSHLISQNHKSLKYFGEGD